MIFAGASGFAMTPCFVSAIGLAGAAGFATLAAGFATLGGVAAGCKAATPGRANAGSAGAEAGAREGARLASCFAAGAAFAGAWLAVALRGAAAACFGAAVALAANVVRSLSALAGGVRRGLCLLQLVGQLPAHLAEFAGHSSQQMAILNFLGFLCGINGRAQHGISDLATGKLGDGRKEIQLAVVNAVFRAEMGQPQVAPFLRTWQREREDGVEAPREGVVEARA